MFIEVLIISLLYSKIKGGRLKELENIQFKKSIYIFLGFLINVGIMYMQNKKTNISILDKLFVLSYILILFGLLYNKELRGINFIILGIVLNLIPIFSNNLQMPVSIKAMGALNVDKVTGLFLLENSLTHQPLKDNMKFKILSDIIPMPFFIPKVISIGDIVLSLGIFLFIREYTKYKLP